MEIPGAVGIYIFFGARCSSMVSVRDGSCDRSFVVDPLSYFSFQPMLSEWYNKLVCAILSLVAGFLSGYLRRHITINKCVECVVK